MGEVRRGGPDAEKLCGAATPQSATGIALGRRSRHAHRPAFASNLISEVPFIIPTKPGLLSEGGTNTSPLGPQNPQISKREMSEHLSQTLGPILPG